MKKKCLKLIFLGTNGLFRLENSASFSGQQFEIDVAIIELLSQGIMLTR